MPRVRVCALRRSRCTSHCEMLACQVGTTPRPAWLGLGLGLGLEGEGEGEGEGKG